MTKTRAALALVVTLAVVVLVLGNACAGPHYVAGQRKAPPAPPAEIAHLEQRLPGHDGTDLFTQSWKPATGPVRGVVVIAHGLKDYSDRYAAFAEALVGRGYAVQALDHRGHGDSAGDRVWIASFDEYLKDFDLVVQKARRDFPDKPLFVFGHSMGGNIVTRYALDFTPKPAGLITSAGALHAKEPGAVTGTVKFFSAIAPRLAVFELDDNKFSRDQAIVASMKTDPLIFDGKAPARTAAEVIRSIESIEARASSLDVPVLCLHGSADEVTPPEGSQALVDHAATKDKRLERYEGFFHDLLHEPGNQKVVDDMLGWLDAHAPAPM